MRLFRFMPRIESKRTLNSVVVDVVVSDKKCVKIVEEGEEEEAKRNGLIYSVGKRKEAAHAAKLVYNLGLFFFFCCRKTIRLNRKRQPSAMNDISRWPN